MYNRPKLLDWIRHHLVLSDKEWNKIEKLNDQELFDLKEETIQEEIADMRK